MKHDHVENTSSTSNIKRDGIGHQAQYALPNRILRIWQSASRLLFRFPIPDSRPVSSFGFPDPERRFLSRFPSPDLRPDPVAMQLAAKFGDGGEQPDAQKEEFS
jgi:hypothetical protein